MTHTSSPAPNYGGLITLTLVFFFWGFIAAGNSVFIPFCKGYFSLDQFQSQLVDFAFYFAYYIGALFLFVLGGLKGRDMVRSWGYKRSIVYGLLFSALGAGVVILYVEQESFSGILAGLFIVALGFSLQQTSANPFMIAFGEEATGSSRINLGGGVNSLGTTIGPIIVSLALFGSAAALSDKAISDLPLQKVEYLYACVGLLFVFVAIIFGWSKRVPAMQFKEQTEKSIKSIVLLITLTVLLMACYIPVMNSYRSSEVKDLAQLRMDREQLHLDDNEEPVFRLTTAQIATEAAIDKAIADIEKPLELKRLKWLLGGLAVLLVGLLGSTFLGRRGSGWGALQYPQITLGMLAIFVYVGVEVALASNLGELLKQSNWKQFETSEIAPFVSMFWGSLMIGRWTGAINAFQMSAQTKFWLRFLVPLIAFGVVLGFARLAGYDVSDLYWYILCVFIQMAAFFLTKDKPALTLGVFGLLGGLATLIAIYSDGMISIYAVLSGGLFCSIMWPCIFSLALAGTGKYQAQGSALLVMMILGGAILPPIQGKLADIVGIQSSYWVSALCFGYLALFAFLVKRILLKQNVNFDAA